MKRRFEGLEDVDCLINEKVNICKCSLLKRFVTLTSLRLVGRTYDSLSQFSSEYLTPQPLSDEDIKDITTRIKTGSIMKQAKGWLILSRARIKKDLSEKIRLTESAISSLLRGLESTPSDILILYYISIAQYQLAITLLEEHKSSNRITEKSNSKIKF